MTGTPAPRRFVSTTRMEAFSDGVFAIAITLLVLDLAIGQSGTPVERVLEAWPVYLAYLVSFLTIGAAWLAHTAITDHLTRADLGLLRLNLLLLLLVSVLPFPTRLVAEELKDVDAVRLFVAIYGLILLGVRVLLYAFDEYARREHLDAQDPTEEGEPDRHSIVPVVIGYLVAILIGIVLPGIAVGLYCLIAVYLIAPFREIRSLFSRRT